MTMDSGSHVDVLPAGAIPQVKTKPCSGDRKGRKMVAANGTVISESGGKRIQATTEDGMEVDWPFIAGGVKKALKSTAVTCDEGDGHWVIHTSKGGWVVNVKTKKKIAFSRIGKPYVLDLWIKCQANGDSYEIDVDAVKSDFTRQSRRP